MQVLSQLLQAGSPAPGNGDGADTGVPEVLRPFAAVLSGTLALIAPRSGAGEPTTIPVEGTEEATSPSSIVVEGMEETHSPSAPRPHVPAPSLALDGRALEGSREEEVESELGHVPEEMMLEPVSDEPGASEHRVDAPQTPSGEGVPQGAVAQVPSKEQSDPVVSDAATDASKADSYGQRESATADRASHPRAASFRSDVAESPRPVRHDSRPSERLANDVQPHDVEPVSGAGTRSDLSGREMANADRARGLDPAPVEALSTTRGSTKNGAATAVRPGGNEFEFRRAGVEDREPAALAGPPSRTETHAHEGARQSAARAVSIGRWDQATVEGPDASGDSPKQRPPVSHAVQTTENHHHIHDEQTSGEIARRSTRPAAQHEPVARGPNAVERLSHPVSPSPSHRIPAENDIVSSVRPFSASAPQVDTSGAGGVDPATSSGQEVAGAASTTPEMERPVQEGEGEPTSSSRGRLPEEGGKHYGSAGADSRSADARKGDSGRHSGEKQSQQHPSSRDGERFMTQAPAAEEGTRRETAQPPSSKDTGPLPEAVESVPMELEAELPDVHEGLLGTRQSSEAGTDERGPAEGRLSRAGQTVRAAWFKTMLGQARRLTSTEDGWKVLEMNLDEGDGTVTIKARREDGRVAVAVGFSDPELRSLAALHADRLQQALQAEYDTAVDFSLFSGGGTGHARDETWKDGASSAGRSVDGQDGPPIEEAPARRVLPTGTQYEWIG